MFDNKTVTTQPSSTNDEIIHSKNKSIPNNPNVVPEPFRPKKENKEPEDIFSNSDPVNDINNEINSKTDANEPSVIDTNNNLTSNPNDLINNQSQIGKTVGGLDNSVSSEDTIPSMPIASVPNNKKSMILLTVIVLIIISLLMGAYWFFILKKKTPSNSIVSSNQPATVAESKTETKPVSKNKENKSKQDNSMPISQIKDSDGDGLYDEAEVLLGTSINSPDTDNDGLTDKDEVKVYKTDPLKQDTDNDGWLDGEEISNRTNPLEIDPAPQVDGHYVSNDFKVEFSLLDNMVFEGDSNGVLRFNDNTNQIKFYIYLNNSQPDNLTPDVTYFIAETNEGKLIIKNSQQHEDATPYSTDLSTNVYHANNGLTYLIRYVATKRADNHLENFEKFLQSFIFKK